MNTRDLEYLLALQAAGKFGKAAQRCRVSQPTLSTQVAKLESELGVRLFERGPRGITPTPVGERVLERARRVLDEVAALRAEAELKLHLKGAIRNGVTREEIKEAILQAAIYCGGPAALEATRVARQAFAEMDAPDD